MITVTPFGRTSDGQEVLAFTLEDGDRKVRILNYGGIVQSLIVPDRNGQPVDVVLGYNTLPLYEKNRGYLGALIGRFGNRIGEGKFYLDGELVQLAQNDRGNHLHGGTVGFNKKVWAYEVYEDELVLSYESPDGEENYPGNLSVMVAYTFKSGELRIHYHATCDKKTVCNLTNHAYFNLNGEEDGSALDNILYIDSDFITPTNETMIPVGGFREVKDTPFDFNMPKTIGQDIEADDPDLKLGNGYDHCYVLKNVSGQYVKYAVAYSPKTGIRMSCFTDMPAVQFYSGNGLNQQGKTVPYGKRAGFCLETQAIPNNVNVAEYNERGSSILEPEQLYSFTSAYRFDIFSEEEIEQPAEEIDETVDEEAEEAEEIAAEAETAADEEI